MSLREPPVHELEPRQPIEATREGLDPPECVGTVRAAIAPVFSARTDEVLSDVAGWMLLLGMSFATFLPAYNVPLYWLHDLACQGLTPAQYLEANPDQQNASGHAVL